MIDSDKEKVMGVLKEISNSMTRSEAERDYIKSAVDECAAKYQIEKKLLRKLATVYHKQNFNEERTSADDFATLYEDIVG